MSRRKTLEQITVGGTARRLTRAQRAARQELESTAFVLGEPTRPQGMERSDRNAWDSLAADLLSRRVLAKSDGPALAEYVAARRAYRKAGSFAEKAAAKERQAKALEVWNARAPFAEQVAPQSVSADEGKPAVHLSDFIDSIRRERESFSSRLVPERTVCLDEGGIEYEWPEGDAARIARDYASEVVQGTIVAGELVRLACKRFLSELEIGHTRGFFFDPVAARGIKAWFDGFVKDFQVLPWHVFIVVNIFAWKWATGYRRFFVSWLATGRKNGKSTFLAAIGMFCLIADLTDRAEVYVAATKKDQAKIIWKDARHIRSGNEDLKAHVKAPVGSLFVDETDSFFQALSADAHTMDGLRPSCCLLDEIHEHPSSAVTKRLQSGTLSRPQPLMISATTAGQDRDSWCYSQHEIYERMLRGMAEDFSFSDTRFVYIASLDEGDDPRREELWIKANPNLGVSLTLESLRTQAAELESDPQSIFDFQRFHANIWNSVVRGHSLPYDAIEACVGVPWTGTAMALREAFLKESDQLHADLPFFGGFDLGLSDDLAALVLITRADLGDLVGEGPTEVKTVIVPYFWISEAKIPEREKSLRVPLRLWVREGWIRIAGHGDMVDLDIVEKDLLKIFERHRIREIGYDPWKADRFFGSLVDRGFVKAMAVKQLPSFLTIPSRELKSGIIKGTFAHLGNPVYKWMCAGVDLEPSETTGGIKPAKSDGDRRNKIDAISATVCGLQRMYAPEWKNVFRDFSDFKFTTV